ncbi:MAG TPA: DUF6230 family protein [Ktedonobacteraceae bacterium]|nr:DUF6230 family protein [Ktedonobacteraceae bacterium]
MDHSQSQVPVSQSQGNGNATAAPMVGGTDRRIFWGVMLASFLVLGFMTFMVSSGAVAMALTTPIPFTIQASVIKGTNFHLYPGVSGSDHSTPVAVNTLDGTIANQVISKTVQIPAIGPVTMKLSAGSGSTPVKVTGLTTDLSSYNSSSSSFSNMDLTTGTANGFQQDASSAELDNVTINSPYLMVNSITLPGLSVSITR